MDPLFHFVFPSLVAFAAKVKIKHRLRDILLVGALSVLIDLDHFIGVERATFHNIFITFLIPLAIVLLTFIFKTKYDVKGFAILLLIFLSSHLVLDLFPGEIALFYPLSDKYYSFSFDLTMPVQSKLANGTFDAYLISSTGTGILIYFIIIFLPCLFLDDIIEIMERRHESFRKAFRDLKKSLQ